MSIRRSRWFPLDCDLETTSTTGESTGKCIGTSHYQNWPGCDRQNPCQLGVYGNESG
jgi:hypothetical protein